MKNNLCQYLKPHVFKDGIFRNMTYDMHDKLETDRPDNN